MKILNIVGARPNFMKIAPIIRAMKKYPKITHKLVHTGQHYDKNMSKVFFKELGIPKPDIDLNVGSVSHARQTARIMESFEAVLLKEKPDLVLVVGDVNSTIACALVASKLSVKVAHVEAGLRSFDRSMPEEVNRVLTDHISDFLFTTCLDANQNLLNEGIDRKKIYFVGNVMIDSLFFNLKKIKQSKPTININDDYALLTLHRPSNVDDRDVLEKILKTLVMISKDIPIVFPAHPRTLKSIKLFSLQKYLIDNIKIIDPLGYFEFLKLVMNAKLILTDSGGIQEESSMLNVPCLTLRENTERPITVQRGTNVLVKLNHQKIMKETQKVLDGNCKKKKVIKFWDGRASDRIVKVLLKNT